VADSGAKAVDEYGRISLYFNNVLWHHGGNPPGQEGEPDGERLCGRRLRTIMCGRSTRAKR